MRTVSSYPLIRRLAGLAAPLLALLVLAPPPANAQQGSISGQVVDAGNLQALQGVQVFVPDSDLGSLTDGSGRYTISGVPAGQVRVRARLIGYQVVTRSVDVGAGESVTLDFQIPVSAVSLQEMVVTATGGFQRREVGNAIATVDANDIVEKRGSSTLTNLLQGQATGVTIRANSGSVGAASSLNIRGNSSLGLGNTPIIIVDGARIDNATSIGAGAGGQDFSVLDDINPDDIASIEIIKGPAAAALYGTQAASGLIRIETKQGSAAGPRWNFRVEQGSNWDATDWWSMHWNPSDAPFVGGFLVNPKDTIYVTNLLEEDSPQTQFFDTPWRTGHLQTYGGSVRGGSEAMTYFVSGQYDDSEGNTASNELRRWSGRANFNVDPGPKTDLSISTGFTSNRIRLPESDNSFESLIGNALGFPDQGRMVRSDPNLGGEPIETCFLAFEAARGGDVFFGQLPLDVATDVWCFDTPFFAARPEKLHTIVNSREQERFTGSASLTFAPVEMWTNRVTLGYDEGDAKLFNLTPVDPERPFGSDSDGLLFRRNSTSRNLTIGATSSVELELTDALGSQTTVGAQYFRETVDATEAVGREFPAGSPAINNAVDTETNDFFIESRTAGVYFEERLSWRDRVFVAGAVRLDDNAAFGENLGLQTYPSVQASWVVSEEDGFPEFFEQLRLRAAWGRAGRQPGPNDALALLTPVPVAFRGTDELGVRANQPANPDLEPETGEEIEVGLDATVWDGRLDLVATYYNSRTKNGIVQDQLPPSLGFPGAQFTNIGELFNRGVEIGLDVRPLDLQDVTWIWGVNLSSNDNEITELETPIIGGSQRFTEGFPYASWFTERVFVNDAGEVVVEDEATFHGQPTPEWEGSVSSTLILFDRITLYGLVDFAVGHQHENAFEDFSCGFAACEARLKENADGTLTDEARIKRTASAVGSESPYIYDADWAKLRTVSARVDLPTQWAGLFGARSASVSVAGENLALWTEYPGTDPEANFAGTDDSLERSQLWTIPPARKVLATLSVTF